MDDKTLDAIQADIRALDPQADKRCYLAHTRTLQRQRGYNKAYYMKHCKQLKEQSRGKYVPVLQSSDDNALIDYDML